MLFRRGLAYARWQSAKVAYDRSSDWSYDHSYDRSSDHCDDAILVLNCGSSSVKYQVLDMEDGERCLLKGHVDGIGADTCKVTEQRAGGEVTKKSVPGWCYLRAMSHVVESAQGLEGAKVVGVGHRVVHGGKEFTKPVVVNEKVLQVIRKNIPLAPLHNPGNIHGIEAAMEAFGEGVPHVAAFDTAFHHTIPTHASMYAIPYETSIDLRIKRYGFHGMSHQFVSQEAAALLGLPYDKSSYIVAHLGSGCSATAVRKGKSADTTMGMTPLDGLVMGTRAGQLDPGVEEYLCNELGIDISEVTTLLNKRSGLLGVSGISADMRVLTEYALGLVPNATEEQVQRASLAIDMFVYRLCRHISALMVACDSRCNALVFTGGIGEGSVLIRHRVLSRLRSLGLFENPADNETHGENNSKRLITYPDSPMLAMVIPTNEELQIARLTVECISSA